MFQYAFGRACAKRLGAEMKLAISDRTLNIHSGFELERLFDIHATTATPADIKSVLGLQRYLMVQKVINACGLRHVYKSSLIQEQTFNYSPEVLHLRDGSYISGYWQSEKYFMEIRNEILADFSFRLPMCKTNFEFSEKIASSNSIALHVRRNDFAKNPSINATHGLCSLDYYEEAIGHITKRVDNPSFFIFSDDLQWVRENLSMDYPCNYVHHNTGADSYNDMRLMSLCKHNIIANSSFSWWGAWLNRSSEKIVIAPKKWFAKEINTEDLLPANWIRL